MPRCAIPEIEKFERNYIPEPNTGCWLWIGETIYAYGSFCVRRKHFRAHRWAYEKFIGVIPEGLVLDHLCKTPCCVNPNHLEPVTQKINVLRGKIGSRTKITHCKNGHNYSDENTYLTPSKSKRCMECARIHRRKYHQNKRKIAL